MPPDQKQPTQPHAAKKKVSRSPGQKTVTISMEDDLLKQIDARCGELDEDRSSYLRKCARLEIRKFLLGGQPAVEKPVKHTPRAAAKAKRAQLRDIDTVSLAVFGTIPAGGPNSTDGTCQPIRYMRVRRGRFPDGSFGLDVRGNSMNAARPNPVLDGETVILLHPDVREPQHNDIVAALCDGQTTLKRLICKPGKPCTLHAESTNPAFARDIVPAHDLTIQGVVIGKL